MRLVTRSAVAVVAAACAVLPAASWAKGKAAKFSGYTMTKIVTLGDPAPGGGDFEAGTDFELGDINDKGTVSFVTEVAGGEGIFYADAKGVHQIARVGTDSPAGGRFGPIAGAMSTMNNRGDIAFYWHPETGNGAPGGLGAVVFRWSKRKVTPLFTIGDAAPGGGTFQGADLHAHINSRGDVVFPGQISGADIDPTTPPGDQGLGTGIFKADAKGRVSVVVRPGDPAPGGRTFDFAENPSINDKGDVAFGAHLAGDACGAADSQHVRLFCVESVYVRRASGQFESIAHVGDPASGGTFAVAFGPVINNAGDVLFVGNLTPSSGPNTRGIFLNHAGWNATVVRPGDLMPGGGHVVDTTDIVANYDLNDRGDVSFDAVLDTDDDHDGKQDSGVYVRFAGALAPTIVARTGTVVPGVGTIAHIQQGFSVGASFAQGCAVINNRAQVAFQAVMADGKVVLFKATPHK